MEDRESRKNKIIHLINDQQYRPMKQKELAFLLSVKPEDREEFHELLAELVRDGRVILTKRGKYQALSDFTRTGTFIGHHKGFGFVAVEGEEEDYYIPEYARAGALHGDRVMIRLISAKEGRRKEAEIIRIVERVNTEVVGYYQKRKNYGFVIPDNQRFGEDIYVPAKKSMGAVTGHKVVVRLTSYGDKMHKPEGEVIEIIGHVNDPGTDILSIIRAYNLPMEFSDAVMGEAAELPDRIVDSDLDGRLDLREIPMVTIDGEDAKDLDDAVSLEKNGQGYRLGVHIADVSHYVRENSLLDEEALKRGTSIYLTDRVIPMLPHKLSNGICSLNAGEDRLALSCIMELDHSGKVMSHRIVETVIRVDRRMSYNQVHAILLAVGAVKEKNEEAHNNALEQKDSAELVEEYMAFVDMFVNMKELSDLIRARRRERGSIDFDFPEASIRVSETGEPIEIGVRDRNPAHKIIEDFMLLANETIAEEYFWLDAPFEFRVHEKPDMEKLEKLKKLIEGFGYYFKASGEAAHPKEFQKLLEHIEGTDEEDFISRMTLRSMQQARYATQCIGHFGLAAKYYCHFTSPIRRYPDLQIHRIIKENLHGGLTNERISHYNSILPGVADSNSKCERRAAEAEREVERLKKVQYMSRHIGEAYTGIISGVTGYGFYVELPNTIEGMVRIATIPGDFYLYDGENMLIYGRQTGIAYQLGQKVDVTVTAVNKQLRTIDFEL